MAERSIKENYDTNLNIKAKDEATPEIEKVKGSLKSLQDQVNSFSRAMESLTGLLGLGIIHEFSSFADDVVEIDNRLKLLNNTVLNTGLNLHQLTDAASRSRTSLKEFGEQFNRIGMASGKYFQDNPTNLLKIVETLNKQFQSMHLTRTQLGSVQTELLNGIEAGSFGTAQLESLMMHDSPLIRGFIDSQNNLKGRTIQDIGSSGDATAKAFFDYVLSSSQQINQEFDQMTMTLSQIGTVFKNDFIDMMSDFLMDVTQIANMFYKVYENIKMSHPALYTLFKMLVQTTLAATTMAGALKSLYMVQSMGNLLFGGISGKVKGIIGLAAFGVGAYNLKKAFSPNVSAPPTEDTTTSTSLKNIEAEVKSINQKVGISKDTMNDLVSRTENLVLHTTYNNNSNSSFNVDIAEQLAKVLQQDLKTNGIRG